MVINGRETGFKLTVGAALEIGDLCPDNDLAKVDTLFDGGTNKMLRNACKVIRALNRGYELSEKSPTDDTVKVLTTDELQALEYEEFMDVLNEAMKAFKQDQSTTVQAEPKKEKDTQEHAEKANR